MKCRIQNIKNTAINAKQMESNRARKIDTSQRSRSNTGMFDLIRSAKFGGKRENAILINQLLFTPLTITAY